MIFLPVAGYRHPATGFDAGSASARGLGRPIRRVRALEGAGVMSLEE